MSAPHGSSDPARPLRICFVCDELPPAPGGGIGAVVRTLGTRLRAEGHEVFVVGHYPRRFDWPADGPVVGPILPEQDDLRGRPMGGRRALREAVQRLHARVGLDVVEWPTYQGPFWSNVPGTVDVLRLHSPLPSGPEHWLSARSLFMQWMRLRTARSIPNWIAVSRWVFDDTCARARCRPRRHAVIHNPVDCAAFHPPADDRREPLLLFVGALTEIKGAFTLAEALRDWLPQHPDLRVVLAGRDPDGRGAARVQGILGQPLASRVELPGPLSLYQVADLLRRARIVAAPGDLETFGNVWAEAMASGAPLIASNTAAGPEVVPEDAGLHVSPGDVAALRGALDRLLGDPELCQRLGRRGREVALERYSVESVSRASVDFYRSLAGRE
jgi:glycosyltransferase involved in cell wall biosynthesis